MARACFAVCIVLACSSTPKQARQPKNTSSNREVPYVLWLEAGEPELGRNGESEDTALSYVPAAGTWWYEVRVRELPPTPASFELSIQSRTRHRPQLALIDERGVAVEAVRSKTSPVIPRTYSITLPASLQHPSRFLLRVVTSGSGHFRIDVAMSWRWPPAPEEPIPAVEVHPPCDLKKPDFKNPNCCQASCGLVQRTCRGTILSGDKKWADISLGMNDHVPRGARGSLWQPDGHRHKVTSSVLVFDVADTKSLVQFASPDLVDATQLSNSYVILAPPDECIRQSRP